MTEDIISRVTDTFGTSFGKHQQPALKLSFPFTAVPEKRIFTEREDAMQSAVKMGYTTITRNHPDYLKLRVLMTLFGGYFGSRLMSNIREKRGILMAFQRESCFIRIADCWLYRQKRIMNM